MLCKARLYCAMASAPVRDRARSMNGSRSISPRMKHIDERQVLFQQRSSNICAQCLRMATFTATGNRRRRLRASYSTANRSRLVLIWRLVDATRLTSAKATAWASQRRLTDNTLLSVAAKDLTGFEFDLVFISLLLSILAVCRPNHWPCEQILKML